MKLIRVQSIYTMTPMYHLYKDMTLHVPNVHEQAHGEAQEGHQAHQINQHAQEMVLNALRCA
jgi:hypothetical protein